MTREQPTMMTVREVARTGLMSEHALRLLLKAGKLPAIFIGKKALINYDKLCAELQGLEAELNNWARPSCFPETDVNYKN